MTQTARPGSRERMIEAAIVLMRESGLSGAGINEIVRESGAPKGSVYHFFPDGKQQIAAESVRIYSTRVQDFMDTALSGQTRPDAKIRALFDAFAERVEQGEFQRSCAVGTVSLDLRPGLEELRVVLASALSDWAALIERHVDLGDPQRTRSFSRFVITAIEGAYVRCRAERSSRPFTEAGTWLAGLARPL